MHEYPIGLTPIADDIEAFVATCSPEIQHAWAVQKQSLRDTEATLNAERAQRLMVLPHRAERDGRGG